jgi:DNA-binding transcriptional LysR family regulator
MDRFAAVTAFARVVELGSFGRAAERLGLSTSAISRQVAELEQHLDVRLLNRTTRRLSLTEAGQAYYERCVQLLADLEEADASVRPATVVPKGTLRLTCGVTFGERWLTPAIVDFGAAHPGLTFDLDLSDRVVDLVEEGFDLAVRIGSLGTQAMVARRIGWTRLICCASPEYLRRRGTPQTPDDLLQHDCLAYTYVSNPAAWTFEMPGGERRTVRVPTQHRANSGRMLTSLAAAGMGIALEPDFIVAPEVRTGDLAEVLTRFPSPRSPIAAVYPSRRHLSAKVRAFVDFLIKRFSGSEQWSLQPLPTYDSQT